MAGVFTGCSEDDDLENGGRPMISYIRVTRPASADSLITKAGQGSLIAIVGQNLGNVRELWFNDQPAALTPTYITNNTIIVRVPSQIPTEVTNKMRLVFSSGEELTHDFTVDISEPRIDRMVSEYVATGEIATIVGDFFYEPLKVTFTGGVEGEVVSVKDDNTLEVRVPQGAQPGPVTITSNFGATESDFWFRDNRNIIADYEDTDFNGWWHGKDFIIAGDDKISGINGKFLRINKENTGGWFEAWVGDGTIKQKTKNIPEDAFANPSKYSLKFEINTEVPLVYNGARIFFGTGGPGDRDKAAYTWEPNIDTKNKWETVSIPFEEIYAANNAGGNTFTYNPNGYAVSFHFVGPGTAAQFGLDNVRVVPNVNP